MAQPTIEPMIERDVEAVARLRLATFFAGTARTLEDDVAGLRGLLDGDGFEAAFVARDGGRPIGSCLLVRHEIDAAHELTPWLAGLVVESACLGLGVGEALVRTVEPMPLPPVSARCISTPGRRAAFTRGSAGARWRPSWRKASQCS